MNLVKRAAQQVGAGLSLSDLDRVLDSMYGGQPSYTGKLVSQTTALAVSAVWACVLGLANDIATLPLLTYRAIENGKLAAKDHYLWNLLLQQANPEMTAYRFKHLMQCWVNLWGNAYAELEISGRGQVTALWPWRPDRTKVSRQGSAFGPLQYTYTMQNGQKFTVPHERMFHLRGLSLDGVVGLSPIEVHKQTVGLSLAVTEHGARFFGNGARPLGILTHPNTLSDVARKNIEQSWLSEHEGLANAHRIAILEEGLTWAEAGASMVDAAYIETYKLTGADVCRIYNFPQHRVGFLDQATNNNIMQLALEYIMYNLSPWTENWKQEVHNAMLSPRELESISVAFNFRSLMRGDHDSMSKFIAALVDRGILNADETREEFLDLNPQPDGIGQKYWKAVNMAPLGDNSGEGLQQVKEVLSPAKPTKKPNGLAVQ